MHSIDTFFAWKNRVLDEPLHMSMIVPCIGKTENQQCWVCKGGAFQVTYEVVFEWGNSRQYEHLELVCPSCLHIVNCRFATNPQPRYCPFVDHASRCPFSLKSKQ